MAYLSPGDKLAVQQLIGDHNISEHDALRLDNEDLIREIDMFINDEYIEQGFGYLDAEIAV